MRSPADTLNLLRKRVLAIHRGDLRASVVVIDRGTGGKYRTFETTRLGRGPVVVPVAIPDGDRKKLLSKERHAGEV